MDNSKRTKVRLDQLLYSRGLFPSREAARRAIMAGMVRKGQDVLDKPGTLVRDDEPFEVQSAPHNFVSRGGLKLERALEQFHYSLEDKLVIDVGASTGGFTDCALQHGASFVYAVDVGYGQLHWKLRNDDRVKVMERTNFRYADSGLFVPAPEVAVMDVSFISTRLMLPKLQEILTSPGDILSLVKPQFEAGREHVGKGGIVRDPLVHFSVLTELLRYVDTLGLQCRGIDYSPISGGDGNIEYLAWWRTPADPSHAAVQDWADIAKDTVIEAWDVLNHQDVKELFR